MNEFKIVTPEKEELLIVEALPEELKNGKLTGSSSYITKQAFGEMLFHHFPGDGFNIWYSNYNIRKPVKLVGFSDDPILEFHTQYSNAFAQRWNGFTDESFPKQYELTFVPDVDTVGEFMQGRRYDTFDIHFSKEFLYPYLEFCPRLERFVSSVENRLAINLLNTVRCLTVDMEQVIRSILNYSFHDGLAGKYFKGRVEELLILLVADIAELEKLPGADPVQKLKATEAMKIILSDFSLYDSVEILARKVGTTEPKLQMAFKQLYGTTVGKFSKDIRMKKAHEILLTNNDILWSVALAVGYNDIGNFSTAFKNFFGYPPGHINKRMKR